MKLVAITVKNFRSITNAYKLQLGAMTVLIGRNNEGKSNILRALVAALSVLQRGGMAFRYSGSSGRLFVPSYPRLRAAGYNWETDFPIGLQGAQPNGMSEITLEFELDDTELHSFRTKIKSTLNGNLPIKISIGHTRTTVSIAKQGRGAKSLTEKAVLISDFVRQRLDFQYIPAVRTAQRAHEVVDEMLSSALSVVESDPKYKSALKAIEDLQKPVLEQLSQSIKGTLVQFLPAIKGVKVQIPTENRSRALRASSEIVIDDGTPTPLKHKGDGVQSLAAIALMRHSAAAQSRARYAIIALEEPESHLHPNAIHELRAVLQDIALKQQIILSTHCPLFVDRSKISANIIVDHNKARSAKSVTEIRELLGVRAADNLRHADLVLVVEGSDDVKALDALIRENSPELSQALDHGILVISALDGAGNLSYKISLLRDALCECHCYLDNDDAGKSAFEQARVDKLITDAQVNFTICNGMTQAEIEDIYFPDVYKNKLETDFGLSLDVPQFRSNKKWSERMRDCFLSQGKQWSDRIKMAVKAAVSTQVSMAPQNALNPHKRGSFDGVVNALLIRLAALRK